VRKRRARGKDVQSRPFPGSSRSMSKESYVYYYNTKMKKPNVKIIKWISLLFRLSKSIKAPGCVAAGICNLSSDGRLQQHSHPLVTHHCAFLPVGGCMTTGLRWSVQYSSIGRSRNILQASRRGANLSSCKRHSYKFDELTVASAPSITMTFPKKKTLKCS
jgi:hypothetical protein